MHMHKMHMRTMHKQKRLERNVVELSLMINMIEVVEIILTRKIFEISKAHEIVEIIRIMANQRGNAVSVSCCSRLAMARESRRSLL